MADVSLEESAGLRLELSPDKCTVMTAGRGNVHTLTRAMAGTGFRMESTTMVLGVGIAGGRRRTLGKRKA
eukprot:2313027-Amphidinium_carterae.1